MLGIDPRAARAAWTVFLLALAIATAYLVRETLVVFMIALLFAYLLMPLVGLVERFTPRQVSQGFALAIVYLLLIGALIGLALTLGSRLVDEANSLASRLPDLLRNRSWIDQIPLPSWLEPARARIAGTIQTELNSGGQQILPYLQQHRRTDHLGSAIRGLCRSGPHSRVLFPQGWQHNARERSGQLV